VTRIQLVAPYHGLAVIAHEIAKKLDRRAIRLDIIEAAGVHALERLHFDADVVISRGVSAMALRSILPAHVPLVELKVSGYDVLRALNHCRRRYKGSLVSVIGSRNMVEGAQSVADILEIELQYCPTAGEEDAAASLDDCIRNGAEVVIGGAFVCGLAKTRGINACLIESGREAVLLAIEEASRVASVALEERVVAERVRTIMDVIDEGIVAVDEMGAVNMWNAAASRIFGDLDPPLRAGRPLREVLPQLDMDAAVRGGRRVTGAVQAVGRTDIVANVYPLAIDGKVLGGVLTFQEAERVQEFEGRIRASLRAKGHEAKYTFDDLASESEALDAVIVKAKKFARADVNVLIFGETGTGKEIFAQSMHNASPRRKGPFVAVNCAALAETLLESELFGYVAGAFTGASKSGKAGLFETAHKGTIFLDEISEIPPRLQSKLLRVLQEQEIMRIGDSKIIPVDVRVFAATNRSLENLVGKGRFRQDLLYRLDVLEIGIPPLRERPEDVRFLARQFLDEYGRRLIGRPMTISQSALTVLAGHDWPGNVRELRNICERASVLAETAEISQDVIVQALGVQARPRAPVPAARPSAPRPTGTIRELSARAIEAALAAAKGNKSEAARALGIGRSTLWRYLQGGSTRSVVRWERAGADRGGEPSADSRSRGQGA
jgi:transcriptional regulator with PAS, ATPase and Fis domain